MSLEHGKRFNPYRMFRGAWVPEALLRNHGVSDGAAVLYGVLGRYAGKDGLCFPRQELLARDMACGERTVRRRLAELQKLKLIRTRSRSIGRQLTVNSYEFLWNTLLETGQLSMMNRTEVSALKRTFASYSNRAFTIGIEESQLKESQEDINTDRSARLEDWAVENSGEPEPDPGDPKKFPEPKDFDTEVVPARSSETANAGDLCEPDEFPSSPASDPPGKPSDRSQSARWEEDLRKAALRMTGYLKGGK